MTPSRRSLLRLAAAPVLVSLGEVAVARSGGSVSGRVVDEEGRPLAGIHVEAVSLSMPAHPSPSDGASLKTEGTSGADGRFRLDLAGLPPGEVRAQAFEAVQNGPNQVIVELVPDTRDRFAEHDTVVRNFRREIVEESDEHPYGNAGVFVMEPAVASDATSAMPALDGAEVTLVPEDRAGRPIARTVRRTGEGLVVTGVPFGTWRVSATLAGRPLRLRLALPDADETFEASVVSPFTMGSFANQLRVYAKP